MFLETNDHCCPHCAMPVPRSTELVATCRHCDGVYSPIMPSCEIVGHKYGPITRSFITGTPNRRCGRCGIYDLDLEDEEIIEEDSQEGCHQEVTGS